MNQISVYESIVSTLRHIKSFVWLWIDHFVNGGGIRHVAGLTYTTLLSLVPLMTVMLALFSIFPVSERISAQIGRAHV